MSADIGLISLHGIKDLIPEQSRCLLASVPQEGEIESQGSGARGCIDAPEIRQLGSRRDRESALSSSEVNVAYINRMAT